MRATYKDSKRKAAVKAVAFCVYGGILHFGTIMSAVEKGNVRVFTVGKNLDT